MRQAEVLIAGTALIMGEALGHSGEQGHKFLAMTAGIAAVTIVDVRRTTVLLTARAAVGLFAGRTEMMLHAISPGGLAELLLVPWLEQAQRKPPP